MGYKTCNEILTVQREYGLCYRRRNEVYEIYEGSVNFVGYFLFSHCFTPTHHSKHLINLCIFLLIHSPQSHCHSVGNTAFT